MPVSKKASTLIQRLPRPGRSADFAGCAARAVSQAFAGTGCAALALGEICQKIADQCIDRGLLKRRNDSNFVEQIPFKGEREILLAQVELHKTCATQDPCNALRGRFNLKCENAVGFLEAEQAFSYADPAHTEMIRLTEPFGTYAPSGTAATLIGLARRTPLGRGKARKMLYKRLMAADQDAFDVEVRGVNMRLYPKTNAVEAKLLLRPGAYCRKELAFIERALTADMGFVDIGANVGAFAVQVAARTGVQTLAFEPNPAAFERLKTNAVLNPEAQIALDARALSRMRSTVTFRSVDNDLGLSGIDLDHREGSEVAVETLPLVEALEEHGFDLPWGLKIDVEGHEDEVLQPFFETAPREAWPRFAIIEAIERDGVPDVLEIMKKSGYEEALRTRANIGLRLT